MFLSFFNPTTWCGWSKRPRRSETCSEDKRLERFRSSSSSYPAHVCILKIPYVDVCGGEGRKEGGGGEGKEGAGGVGRGTAGGGHWMVSDDDEDDDADDDDGSMILIRKLQQGVYHS